MPQQAPRPCNHRGCPGKIRGERRYCDRHADEELEDKRQRDGRRDSSTARGYGRRWQRARSTFLAHNPLCLDPYHHHPDTTTAATVVDHIEPHRGDENLFWDPDNWQPLCKPCHDHKTGLGQ